MAVLPAEQAETEARLADARQEVEQLQEQVDRVEEELEELRSQTRQLEERATTTITTLQQHQTQIQAGNTTRANSLKQTDIAHV